MIKPVILYAIILLPLAYLIPRLMIEWTDLLRIPTHTALPKLVPTSLAKTPAPTKNAIITAPVLTIIATRVPTMREQTVEPDSIVRTAVTCLGDDDVIEAFSDWGNAGWGGDDD